MIVNSLCLEYLLACKMGKGGDLEIGFRISLWCELVLTISITIKGVIQIFTILTLMIERGDTPNIYFRNKKLKE